MSFRTHPSFTPAPNSESKLWRYMNLPKFLSLIQQKELFMYNLELMARDDKFEGVLPVGNFVHRHWSTFEDVPDSVLKELKNNVIYHETGDLQACLENYKEVKELRIRQAYAHRRSYFVNCWHLNEYESLAMWEIYSKKDEGIAIVSSESNFIDAFSDFRKDIFGGVINYANYDDSNFAIDVDNAFNSILYKRSSFEYEKEYRLVISDEEVIHKKVPMHIIDINSFGNPKVTLSRVSTGRPEDEIERLPPKNNINVPCDLNKLIDMIYVSPSAPRWFFEIIDNLVRQYGMNVPVKQSDLNQDPLK